MKTLYIKYIAERLEVKEWQVENCAILFDEGNTIPFICRYRKEKTGGLDDASVVEIKHWLDVFTEMDKRKEFIISVVSDQDKLTEDLRHAIENCVDADELEDLYLPYKPKRRTKAVKAIEAGLEPLADKMYDCLLRDPEYEASKYINEQIATVEDALAGARDIIAERISETAEIRDNQRNIFSRARLQSKITKAGREACDANNPNDVWKYKSYFKFIVPISKIQSHNLLAMLRGQEEGFLNVKLDLDAEKCGNKIYYDFCQMKHYPAKPLAKHIRMAVDDAFKRLIEPSLSNEIIRKAKEKADIESINVFGENLKQLLLAPPVGPHRVLAIDPGFRNGCKTVCLDEYGSLIHDEIIYPHPPQNQKVKALTSITNMVEKYGIEVIAIGNGTASRETEQFVQMVNLPEDCRVFTVSEDGASIYSASDIAREEFPNEDVTVRGAVSIGRRLMDPLAELVKIDPKSLGVGQYQYDVDQNLLKEKLDFIVRLCVNNVGVNLNTASPYLLAYVSGIGPAIATNIIEHRNKLGGFSSRQELLNVPRLGPKAYEQCAGFLRIRDGKNPLDASAVHPECYYIVDKMAKSLGVSVKELIGNEELCNSINPADFVEGDFGLPTINDIIKELLKPGLDPREEAEEFAFSEEVHDIEDLREGMELPGIVTNITNFGAFVDVGIKENGLIHISQMGRKGFVVPSKVVKLHQQVKVLVISVDVDRARIGLRLLED